jgi:hypothetical protein
MSAEVLIVNSPLFEDKIEGYNEDSLPPLGLGYIATNLTQEGIRTELHDTVANNTPLIEIITQINNATANVVALNVFTTNLDLVRKIIEGITRKVRILIGGLSTKYLHTDIFTWDTPNQIDIVYGDGEKVTPDLVKQIETQKAESEKHLAGSRRYFVITHESQYYIKDLSKLQLNRDFFKNEPIIHARTGFKEANLIASRCILLL